VPAERLGVLLELKDPRLELLLFDERLGEL
jgi:hypothetical protein